jgi:hypothetical protein
LIQASIEAETDFLPQKTMNALRRHRELSGGSRFAFWDVSVFMVHCSVSSKNLTFEGRSVATMVWSGDGLWWLFR